MKFMRVLHITLIAYGYIILTMHHCLSNPNTRKGKENITVVVATPSTCQ